MAPARTTELEVEDHDRDAAFNKAMHGKAAAKAVGLRSLMHKDDAAQKAAVDEYFKHFDEKTAENETDETRAVRRLFPL